MSSNSTHTVSGTVWNQTGNAIKKVWICHFPGKGAAPQYFETQNSLNNNQGESFSYDGIQLPSGGNDQWMVYYQDAFNNLIGTDGLFNAEINHNNGGVTITLDGTSVDVGQKSSIGVDDTTTYTAMQVPMVAGYLSQGGISVSDMYIAAGLTAPTKSGIGIALSGGGSRAMSAGIGQLQALVSMGWTKDVLAMSTVSGGGWVGIPYMFLPKEFSDDDFLGSYLPPEQLTNSNINTMGPSQIGGKTNKMSALTLFISMLHMSHAVSDDDRLYSNGTMIWQMLMARYFLHPYGLVTIGHDFNPSDTFAYSDAVIKNNALVNQPVIRSDPFQQADMADPYKIARPMMISNMMLEVQNQSATTFGAPVVSTPFFTGCLGAPDATTTRGIKSSVGGAAVASQGFNSMYWYLNGNQPQDQANLVISQRRNWALADCLGTSSSAIAAGVLQFMSRLSLNEIADGVMENGPDVLEADREMLPEDVYLELKNMYDAGDRESLLAQLSAQDIPSFLKTPSYMYWSPAHVESSGTSKNPMDYEANFVDGGLMENTGVANLLAFTDINVVFAFINTATAMTKTGGAGIPGQNGTDIQVTEDIAALFGYRPYSKSKGWERYSSTDLTKGSIQSRCLARAQIFPDGKFAEFLKGLWQATLDENNNPGVYPAVLSQLLELRANPLFGIFKSRLVTISWHYLTPASSWNAALTPSVSSTLSGISDFPNYPTIRTGLDYSEVNFLSSFAGFCALPSNRKPGTSSLMEEVFMSTPDMPDLED